MHKTNLIILIDWNPVYYSGEGAKIDKRIALQMEIFIDSRTVISTLIRSTILDETSTFNND